MYTLLVCTFVALCLAGDDIVPTQYGPVQGRVYPKYRTFEGIPYAAPPTGENRWQPTAAPQSWTNPLPALEWKPGCPQNCLLPPHTCPPAVSEDCLYANVFTPYPVATGLPVMVFIHGGHFDQGSSGCMLYDASNMASKGNVIVVSFSYRLGALGWLVTDDLGGNFGFMDQLAALKWVQTNIAAFGGDPNQVTLFGQSAGGTSIRAHLTSPLSKGLFHRVIVQSDPLSLPMQDTNEALDVGNFFMQTIGCSNFTCLKNQPLGSLLEAQVLTEKHISIGHPITVFYPFVPHVDGKFVSNHVWDAIPAGTWNNVPMMIGTMTEDCLLFVYKAFKNYLTLAEYEAILVGIFGTKFYQVTKEYPPPTDGDKRPLFSILGTDYIFSCPARRVLELIKTKYPSTPLYLYQFDHALSFDAWGPEYPFCVGHVCHGSEIPYEFDPPELPAYANFTADEKVLSDQLIKYFTNFAKSGDPNVGSPVKLNWPKWELGSLVNLQFQTPSNVLNSKLLKDKCDFWDTIGYHNGW